jgi:hypothetical protein
MGGREEEEEARCQVVQSDCDSWYCAVLIKPPSHPYPPVTCCAHNRSTSAFALKLLRKPIAVVVGPSNCIK